MLVYLQLIEYLKCPKYKGFLKRVPNLVNYVFKLHKRELKFYLTERAIYFIVECLVHNYFM